MPEHNRDRDMHAPDLYKHARGEGGHCFARTCFFPSSNGRLISSQEAKLSGCRNILALRGDPPAGKDDWEAVEGGFEHGVDLVRYIRKEYGDYFDISVAGYPQTHTLPPEERDQEMTWLKEKVDAGANFIFTQMFYDADLFIDWVHAVRAAGITAPVVPGIMPIQTFNGFLRAATAIAKTIIPQSYLDALEPYKNNDEKVREIGTKLVADMCRKILSASIGIQGLHFYTMNLERGTRLLLEELNLVPRVETIKPLPWRQVRYSLPHSVLLSDLILYMQSLTPSRRSENIRPIFWANRHKSYLSRTENWDEYPNGRFGDSRSPAYGELDGYGVSLKQKVFAPCMSWYSNHLTISTIQKEDAVKLWGRPTTFKEITDLFEKFCLSQLSALPWSDQPVLSETSVISGQLARVNALGFLTINSQPAVNGLRSDDKTFGWGPSNGYVYQKAYMEFFASPESFDSLITHIERDPGISYYVINKRGDLRTNTTSDGPNAVTWGVFPGKEVVQPTIVEAISFMAWKVLQFHTSATGIRTLTIALHTGRGV
jgi:methylenetetrahydrofolate reductase (NADPH)